MKQNMFAYTASSQGVAYPQYVSINRCENGDVEVSVRSEPTVNDDGHAEPGTLAVCVVPEKEWRAVSGA